MGNCVKLSRGKWPHHPHHAQKTANPNGIPDYGYLVLKVRESIFLRVRGLPGDDLHIACSV